MNKYNSGIYILCIVLLLFNVASCSTISYPYVGPLETSDPKELIKIADLRLNAGRPIGARTALQKALDVSNNGNDLSKFTLATILTNLGRTYHSRKRGDTAVQYYRKSLVISEELGYDAVSFNNNYNMSDIYHLQKDSATACDYFKKARGYYKKLEKEQKDPPYGFGKNNLYFEKYLKQKVNNFSKVLLLCDYPV